MKRRLMCHVSLQLQRCFFCIILYTRDNVVTVALLFTNLRAGCVYFKIYGNYLTTP